MKKKMRLSFQKGDAIAILIVVVLIVLSCVFFLPRGETENASVEVFRNGEKVYEFSLKEDRNFTVEGE